MSSNLFSYLVLNRDDGRHLKFSSAGLLVFTLLRVKVDSADYCRCSIEIVGIRRCYGSAASYVYCLSMKKPVASASSPGSNSRLQSGHDRFFKSQGLIHAVWNRCCTWQGKGLTRSFARSLSMQIAHSG